MAKWKLIRQTFGTEEFTFNEGEEVTVGRGFQNSITLSSLVISRNHCVLKIKKNEILITDLQSSNGVFVGTTKIPPNIPYSLKDSDIVGIGWTANVPLGKVQDSEKYVFRVIKEHAPRSGSLISRITFQNDIDDEFEDASSFDSSRTSRNVPSPIIDVKPTVKRKIELDTNENNKNETNKAVDGSIIVLSDSDNEAKSKHQEPTVKKPKLEPIHEGLQKQVTEKNINNLDIINIKKEINLKVEDEYPIIEAFNVKQEYLGYDDELIQIDSDSDSESEQWYLRLSQSSPGKPFIKVSGERKESKPEDSSYSQIEDDLMMDRLSDIEDDLIRILSPPPTACEEPVPAKNDQDKPDEEIIAEKFDRNLDLNELQPVEQVLTNVVVDEVDGFSSKDHSNDLQNNMSSTNVENSSNAIKKTQMIEPQLHTTHKMYNLGTKSKSSTHKHDKKKSHSSKRHMSSSQKEERKKKLKEIAIKEKEANDLRNSKNNLNNTNKTVSGVRVTSSNRGAFLTDSVQVVKPMKRKESPQKSKSDKIRSDKCDKASKAETPEVNTSLGQTTKQVEKTSKKDRKSVARENIENKDKQIDKTDKKDHKTKTKHESSKSKADKKSKPETSSNASCTETRVPLKSLKPLTDSEDSFAGKPFSKVEPYKKTKKTVRFTEAAPEIRYYEIPEGNKMKKTSLVKTTLVDVRKMPIFSLEKLTLMKILRWNPSWLEEQINNNEPPPILGHSNPPMTVFHSFTNHHQYVQLIGDLVLMEIWECLSIAYMKKRNQPVDFQMRIASLSPVPPPDRHFDIYNLSVDVSVPTVEVKNLPRVGEVLLVSFGPESTRRFFFVHNVRSLPSPPSNKNSFFNISLNTTFTEKMKTLKPGEIMVAVNLAYIQKELSLFEAMAYMASSPLSEIILRPEARHFKRKDDVASINLDNAWTSTLNRSQYNAVKASVLAALSDQPSIQMVQGPPGTGKSSVICSIVMAYFYDAAERKQPNRGKILICATSNAAVDELVLRLLKIRQQLKQDRFRMVRVGRLEAMHQRAREVSSQTLAQRELRSQQEPMTHPGVSEEISRLEAKLNMWKQSAQNAFESKNDVRVAYCESRVAELNKRIGMLKSSGTVDVLRPEQMISAERRIIEGADIIVTTLSSAFNHKLRGLKRRIALCVVDEAGQAIEPETLIPLTLDVGNLTLIGDPQQLPGYICSQRAKQYGLGESLFSRLCSCSSTWPEGAPVTLLDRQYRMQEAIADYPNRAFYDSRITTVAPPRPSLTVAPYVLIGIASGDKGQNAAGANEMEAWGVARVAAALAGLLAPQRLSLAVITPYNAHKDLIRRNLRQLQDPTEAQVEVNTVDSFQGQERDVVVVSLARSHGVGFLTDAGRMNVMLTRARHALLVCLNPLAVLKNRQWRTLLEDAQQRKLYTTLPSAMCQPTGAVSNAEILKQISLK